MSHSTFTSIQKQLLENKRENLIARYQATFNQRENTLNEGDKIPLANQLSQLKTEIKEVEVQLQGLLENFKVSNSTRKMESMTSDRMSSAISGKTKIELCQRLGADWQELADYLEIPPFHRRQFQQGRECQAILEWLEERKQLHTLK